MTTQAPLRSRWTKAESVYHVQVTGNGDALHPLVKIQGAQVYGGDMRGTSQASLRLWVFGTNRQFLPHIGNQPLLAIAPGWPSENEATIDGKVAINCMEKQCVVISACPGICTDFWPSELAGNFLLQKEF